MLCVCEIKPTHRDFRGPNNFPSVCVRFRNRCFDPDSIDVDASINRGAQKRANKCFAFALYLHNKIDASQFSGTEQTFCVRSVEVSFAIGSQFNNVDSIDFDASINRGGNKLSNLQSDSTSQYFLPARASVRTPHRPLRLSLLFLSFLSARTFLRYSVLLKEEIEASRSRAKSCQTFPAHSDHA